MSPKEESRSDADMLADINDDSLRQSLPEEL